MPKGPNCGDEAFSMETRESFEGRGTLINSGTMDSGVSGVGLDDYSFPNHNNNKQPPRQLSLFLEKKPGEAGFGFSVVWSSPPQIGRVVDQTAAERGGLRRGDLITRVNEFDVSNLPRDKVINHMQASGNVLKMDVVREFVEYEGDREVVSNGNGTCNAAPLPAKCVQPVSILKASAPSQSNLSPVTEQKRKRNGQTAWKIRFNLDYLEQEEPVVKEFIIAELKFFRKVVAALDRYLIPAQANCLLTSAELQGIVGGVIKIITITKRILDCVSHGGGRLGEVLLRTHSDHMCELLDGYSSYARHLGNSASILANKMTFQLFAKFVLETPVPKGHLDMTSLLFAPLEHLRNLCEIAEEMLRSSPEWSPIAQELTDCYGDIVCETDYMEPISHLSMKKQPLLSVKHLEKRLVSTRFQDFKVCEKGRRWLFGSRLFRKEADGSFSAVWAFLFNDILVLTSHHTTRDRVFFVRDAPLNLQDVTTLHFNVPKKHENEFRLLFGPELPPAQSRLDRLLKKNKKPNQLVLRTPSKELKNIWKLLLQRQIITLNTRISKSSSSNFSISEFCEKFPESVPVDEEAEPAAKETVAETTPTPATKPPSPEPLLPEEVKVVTGVPDPPTVPTNKTPRPPPAPRSPPVQPPVFARPKKVAHTDSPLIGTTGQGRRRRILVDYKVRGDYPELFGISPRDRRSFIKSLGQKIADSAKGSEMVTPYYYISPYPSPLPVQKQKVVVTAVPNFKGRQGLQLSPLNSVVEERVNERSPEESSSNDSGISDEPVRMRWNARAQTGFGRKIEVTSALAIENKQREMTQGKVARSVGIVGTADKSTETDEPAQTLTPVQIRLLNNQRRRAFFSQSHSSAPEPRGGVADPVIVKIFNNDSPQHVTPVKIRGLTGDSQWKGNTTTIEYTVLEEEKTARLERVESSDDSTSSDAASASPASNENGTTDPSWSSSSSSLSKEDSIRSTGSVWKAPPTPKTQSGPARPQIMITKESPTNDENMESLEASRQTEYVDEAEEYFEDEEDFSHSSHVTMNRYGTYESLEKLENEDTLSGLPEFCRTSMPRSRARFAFDEEDEDTEGDCGPDDEDYFEEDFDSDFNFRFPSSQIPDNSYTVSRLGPLPPLLEEDYEDEMYEESSTKPKSSVQPSASSGIGPSTDQLPMSTATRRQHGGLMGENRFLLSRIATIYARSSISPLKIFRDLWLKKRYRDWSGYKE